MISIKKQRLLILSLLVLGLVLLTSSSISAVNAADNSTVLSTSNNENPLNTVTSDVNATDSINETNPDTIISGEVDQCGCDDPFPGVTITVSTLDGTTLASALTDASGLYQTAFKSDQKIFNVTASYPGHITAIQQVTVSPEDSGLYATANFQMGTLGLTKGSTDIIGLDSNNVNTGPNHFVIQIHVTNNAATTAQNVTGTLNFTSANANIFLDPTDTLTKNLGDIAPGATVDLFYLISINRTNAAYLTSRNYSIAVSGTNTGSTDTITGSLFVEKLISQNRNTVTSIVVTPSNPTLDSTFAVTVTSTTASSTYNWVNLPIIDYDASKVQPVSVTISYGSNTSSNIYITNPGTTSFVSQWIFKAIGTGFTPLSALIMDNSGASYHYNSDVNSTTIGVIVTPRADLAITKTVDNNTPNVNDNVTFTITATNNGPNDATGVTVNDLLPAGLQFISATPSTGTYNSGTGVWTIGNLANGGSETLTIIAKVLQTGLITNTAVIQGNEEDPNPLNNQYSAALNGQAADITISKTVNDTTPCFASKIIFTIGIANNGPSNAANVTVQDIIPAGLTLESAVPSMGSYNPANGIWTIGTLQTGVSATLTLQTSPTQIGIINNTAEAFSTTYDPNPQGNTSSVTIDIQPCADLAVIKSVNNTTPNVGDNVTYTITATNNGPWSATGVIVNDLLPEGLQFVSANPSTGTYNSGTGIWTIGNMANGATETLSIVVTVLQSGQITNLAAITGNENDPNPLNNQDDAVINGQATADLAIVKTVDNTLPNVGENVTFTLTVFNAGPDDATGTMVNDLLPSELALVSANPSTGSYDSNTGIWTIGTLMHGSTAIMTMVATATQFGFFTNIAVVSSNVYDPHPEDNTSAVTIDPMPSADLAVVKSVNNTTPNVGDNVTYTITATNNGPNNATGVTVTDNLPAGLQFVSATASTGTYNSGTGTWTIGNLANGATETLSIVVKVLQGGQITNLAVIGGNEHDPQPLNNQGIAVINGQSTADLCITKTVDKSSVYLGDMVTFTVTACNAGPDDAVNAIVQDLLPAGLSLVSATPSVGSYNSSTGVWSIGTLFVRTPVSLTLVAEADQTGLHTNTAVVSSSTFDPHPDDNTASATVNVLPSADLAVVKSVNNTTPNVGDNVTYTITATNNGPNNATGVTVTDNLPAGLQFVSATASTGTYNSGTGTWTIGNLANGATETLSIVVKVLQGGQITNLAVIGGNEHDPQPLNNQGIAVINGQSTADLCITKTVDKSSVYLGDMVTFTVTACNAGPDDAVNAIVQDLLPAGLSLVSATPSVGSYNSSTGVWSIGTLFVRTPVSLTLVAEADQTGLHTNTAVVSSSTFDPHPDDNTASATVNVLPSADLAVVKSVNNTTPNVGDNVTYTITATNNGPNNATGVTVTDNLPAGLEFVSATASTGSYNSNTGVWTIGNLAYGATETLSIVVKVLQGGQITNLAFISGNEHDPQPLNNQGIAVINGQSTADLCITKTVDKSSVYLGDMVTFTVTACNAGPDDAVNAIVQDLLPAGLSLVSATPSVGSYNSSTGVWSIGTLFVRTPVSLTLVAEADQTGLHTNTAVVSSSTFDPHPDDNTASATVNVLPSADLAVVKSVNNTTPNVGDNVTYTITATNNGPNNATGVTVTDNLPAGLEFVSATASTGSYNSNTGVWTIGNLAYGATETLSIVVKVLQGGQITNLAFISGNEHDPQPLNNQGIAVINGQSTADLCITKTVDKSSVYLGDMVTFTVTACNAGPDDAVNAIVQDLLPAGLSLVSATPSVGSYNSSTGVWSIGTLFVRTPVSLTLVAEADQTGLHTNTAVVSSSTFDPHPDDNTASATVNVLPSADLAVVKSVNNTTPNVGDNVTYTITATNNGPNNATGVIVTDNLPSGLQFVSASASTGSYNSGTSAWTIGNLANDATETLSIVAKVLQTGQITNIAVIAGNEHDPNPLNNQAIAVINGQTTADLAIVKTADNATVYVGDNVTFTINVFNAGPDSAANVVVNDLLPAGLQFISANPSVGSYNPNTGVWTIGTLAHFATATMTLTANVTEVGLFTNTAVVSSSTYDPHPDDNTSSATVNGLPSADLAVVKSVNNTSPNVGDNVTFTITATNNGPSNANGVTVTDNLPAGLEFVSATASTGSYNSNTGVWTIGNLANGATETLSIIAKVLQTGQITNIAVIAGNEHDPNPLNNQGIAVINGQTTADLAIVKTADKSTVYVGDNVTFTINVFNAGPDSAANVVVNDLLPAGLQFISANPSVGSYNPNTGVWTIGTLTPNSTATLQIVAKILQTGVITNTAVVSSSTYDPHPDDNTSSSSVDGLPSADLAIIKTVNNTNPNLGDTITFTLTATNNGPSNATGVKVNDLLPNGLTFISADPSTSYNNLSGVWNIGNLAKGNSTVLTINSRVDLESIMENIAVISGNEHDPILSNNTDSVIVYPSQNAADLGVIKTTSKTEMITGDNVTFNINVTNYGPDTAINAVVFDTLPNGFSYISSNTTIGLYNPSTGIWTIGDLYNGEVETLSIIAQAVKTGTYVNTSVVDSDTYDPNPYNNTSSVTVVVKSKPQPPQPVNGKTVPMQPTGTPALPLVIGLLMLIGGLLGNKWNR